MAIPLLPDRQEDILAAMQNSRQAASTLALAALLLLPACRSINPTPLAVAQQIMVDDRLFFGRNIPGGGQVSDAEWEDFLKSVVTPRFPAGLSVFQGRGQWLDPRGELVREPAFVVEVLHPSDPAAEAAIAAIAAQYKSRFHQDSVMRVHSSSTVQFY